jgi:general secretion pathway protein K
MALVGSVVLAMLIAIMALAMQQRLSATLDRYETARDQRDRSLQLEAGLDLARSLLLKDARESMVDHRREAWAQPLDLVLSPRNEQPVRRLRISMVDLESRYNLANLIVNGQLSPAAAATAARLVVSAGIPASRVDALLRQIMDQGMTASDESGENVWVDLMTRAGLSGTEQQALSELAVWLPDPSALNVNTASPAVLAAVIPGLDAKLGQVLAQRLSALPANSPADVALKLPGVTLNLEGLELGVSSRHFELSVQLIEGDRRLAAGRWLLQRLPAGRLRVVRLPLFHEPTVTQGAGA